jgi:hypothetical protein
MSSFLVEIKKMSLEEKLQTMELLWDELRENPDNVAFPKWHQDILEQRESLTHDESLHYTDWSEAKKDIEKRVK